MVLAREISLTTMDVQSMYKLILQNLFGESKKKTLKHACQFLLL